MRKYCDQMWKTFPPETHIAIWSVIGLLLLLSVIEGILEQYYPFMPYRKLYLGTGFIPSQACIKGGGRGAVRPPSFWQIS